MIEYPTINPIAFKIGLLSIYWYGVMYVIGFGVAWALGVWRAKYSKGAWTRDNVSDLLFYVALGVLLGGRIGYMLFYNLPDLWHQPWSLFQIRQGGMAFHGGLLGVLLAFYFYARNHGKTFLQVADFTAPLVPLAIALGRIGNFINGELWGRVTTVPWGMIFPHAGPLPRHPSQLYEFGLEGILLFTVLWLYSSKARPTGAVSGLFLILYAVFRCFAEFFRLPDPQYGYLAFNWLTMGQVLSLPMLLIGIMVLHVAYRARTAQ